MDCTINIPSGLLDDEIICFLADRYHTTPTDIVRTFLLQDSFTSIEKTTFRFEENEMEMMRGLLQTIDKN